tara:strand:- start:5807 stop:6484 length:678 start_codon:yes stop_codon:yes gene_type:complete
MEITKNLIVYKHKKHSRLTNFNLGNNYKDKFGKIHYLKDVNGLSINFVTSQSSFILNKTIENDVLTDEWLQNHPDVINGWERTDVQEKEQIDTKNTLDSAQAIIEAAKMNIKDVMDFAKLHKMNMNSNTDVLRAHIIKVAQESPEKFMETHFDPEKDYRVFILDALKSKNLSYKNSTFMYGKQAIGTNEEQVIVWLKDNKDIFALIKHDLRGETPKAKSKTKEKV